MTKEISRRDSLRLGAAAAGLGAVGSLAGCSSIPFIGGGGANYTKWFFEPGTVGDSDHYSFSFTDVQTVLDNEDQFDSDVFDGFESSEDGFPLDDMDVDYDATTSQVSLGQFGGVVQGDFSPDDVIDELEGGDKEYDEEDEQSGYQIFYNEDNNDSVAVSDGEALYSSLNSPFGDQDPDTEATEAIEAMIGASNGEEDLYEEESDAFQKLMSELGSGTFVNGRTFEETEETNTERGQFEAAVASGSAQTVNGETMDVKYVLVFDSEGDVETDDIEDWLDESDAFDDLDDVSVSQSGNAAVVTGTLDTDDYLN